MAYGGSMRVVYVDGCCLDNGTHAARGGIGVYWGPYHRDNLSEKLQGRQTNNRAEIEAACRALEQADIILPGEKGYRGCQVCAGSDWIPSVPTYYASMDSRNPSDADRQRIEYLEIRTDSEFLINSAVYWMAGWKENGWKKGNGEPVENAEDFKRLDRCMKNIFVKWTKVQGHSGTEGNDEADKLANAGAKGYCTR